MTTNTKWDAIYQTKVSPGDPCWLLQHCAHLLPQNNSTQTYTSLDLACGLSANALFLAQLGFKSHAWDNSEVALLKSQQFAKQKQLTLHTKLVNIEAGLTTPTQFDVIVVSQFLNRAVCPAIYDALKPNGLLFYQTFHQHKQSKQGPSNPDFLLQKQELLQLFSELDILFYREDGQQGDHDQGLRNLAYFIGQKTN